jgi:hypothetical protein
MRTVTISKPKMCWRRRWYALDGKTSSILEFGVSELTGTAGKKVTLQVIDVPGNITKQTFPIETDSVVQEDVDSEVIKKSVVWHPIAIFVSKGLMRDLKLTHRL